MALALPDFLQDYNHFLKSCRRFRYEQKKKQAPILKKCLLHQIEAKRGPKG